MDPQNIENPNTFNANTLTDSLDFGRESLGLLPSDFGRESLGFSNPLYLSEIQQGSLGIKSILELSRDSLLPSEKRESLGILHISTIESNFKTPDILLTTINENGNESVCDILNKAFLFPSPRRKSFPSSCSYVSFNANSIEEPSKIFSVPSPNEDVFSNSVVDSVSLGLNERKILGPSEVYNRLRFKSLPTNLISNTNNVFDSKKIIDNEIFNSNDSITSLLNKGNVINPSELSLSVSQLKDNELAKITADSQTNEVNEKENSENICHDSIFIEGKYFANKLANGSLLDDSFENAVGILDNVPCPNWHDISTSPQKNNEAVVIKKECDEKIKNDLTTDLKLAVPKIDHTPKSAKELLHNLSEILNNTTRSDQQRSEGHHLLNSLAELLSDGSNVRISNLDDSGHSSSINDISDPEKIHTDYYEILDFSQKSGLDSGSENCSIETSKDAKKISKFSDMNSNRLSLSLNSALPAKIIQPKIMNRGNLSRISLDSSKNRTGSSNSSIKSDNMSAGNVFVPRFQSNLKVKTTKEVSRKGPLKAVIPLKELKKSAKLRTPERAENGTSVMHSKRTSTPINEPKLKPMAASTPTSGPLMRSNSAEINGRKSLPSTSKGSIANGNSATKSTIPSPTGCKNTVGNTTKRRTLPLSTSPLARNPNSRQQDDVSANFAKSPKTSLNTSKEKSSTSKPSISQDYGKRRNSISSFKREQLPGRPRSNSLPKEPVGIMSALSKIRENLLNSPEFKKLSNKLPMKENNNISDVEKKQTSILPNKRDSVSKLRKMGKENLEK